MKRIVAITLCVLMLICISACKDDAENKSQPKAVAPTVISSDDQAKQTNDGFVLSDDEYKDIKDAFVPAGEIYGEKTEDTPDLTVELSFDYDQHNRIVTVFYLIDDKKYNNTYVYDDTSETLTIFSSHEGVKVSEKVFSYSDIKDIEGVKIVDGYYINSPIITE